MIDKRCFTHDWLQQKSEQFGYNDLNLIEKVVRALTLLDMLAQSGCPFYFKGGSSVMLRLAESQHRLSIDIDIMCPPGTNVEQYLQKYEDNGFLRYELVERQQAGTDIPKSHSKFFYQVRFNDSLERPAYILLDVLYEDCHYQQVDKVPIIHPMIEIDGEPNMVNIPSVGDILGDKMTAFAPDTTGIPYYKKGEIKAVEIIKQLYDIGRLFDYVDNLEIASKAFRAIAPVELGYRHMSGDLSVIYEDIRQTALNIATRGSVDKDKFAILQKGIKDIRPFMYQGGYVIEKAITDAARAAYLATLTEKGITTLDKYLGPDAIADLSIGDKLTNKLNKLRSGNPEAYWYWCKVAELL